MKPFSARPFRAHLFTKTLASKAGAATSSNQGKIMSDRFNTDRMAAFSPQVARRVADIPNSAAARAAEADSDGKRLVVGKQVRIKGEIAGCERLVIEGQVDATVTDVKSLEVTEGGVFKGTTEVESAVIAGTYDGSLKFSFDPGARDLGTNPPPRAIWLGNGEAQLPLSTGRSLMRGW